MQAKLLVIAAGFSLLAGCQSTAVTAVENTNHQLLYVHQSLVSCTGVAPMQCMQVRSNAHEDWSFFYSQIEGFKYEPGYKYTLTVNVLDVPNPPADASSKRYILVDVIDKTKQY